MLEKNNNLVATAISETFNNSDNNYLLGDWCRKVSDFSKNQYSIKFIHEHHWSDKMKMDDDRDYLETFINLLTFEIGNHLNEIHKINEKNIFWEIILRPWLFSIIPQIFDRWEICRTFFEKFHGMNFKFHFIKDYKVNHLFSRPLYRVAQMDDYWNQNIFSRIIEENYLERIKEKKILKSKYFKKEKQKIDLKNIIYYPISFIDTDLINKNEIIFDTKQTSLFNFLKLSKKLEIFPITSSNFFKRIEKDIEKSQKVEISKENLKISLKEKFNNKFEKFCIDQIIEDFPEVFLGYFNISRKMIKKIVNDKKKIIFSNQDIFINDIYRIWVATMCGKNSKLVINTHGGFIPERYVNFNFQNKVANKHITWHSLGLHKNETQLTPLKLVGLKKKKNLQKHLSIIDIELGRYQFRMNSIPTPSEIKVEYDSLVSFIEKLKPKIQNYVKYRTVNNFGWNFKKKFEKKFGKEKIDKSKNLYELISSSKILVHKYPSTPFSESIYLNTPSVLLYKKDSWRLSPTYNYMLKKLENSKILFYEPSKLSDHLNNIWDNVDDWWNSNEVQKTLDDIKNDIIKSKKNWVSEYQNFFDKLKND